MNYLENIMEVKNQWGRSYLFSHYNYFTELWYPKNKDRILNFTFIKPTWNDNDIVMASIIDYHPRTNMDIAKKLGHDTSLVEGLKDITKYTTRETMHDIAIIYNSIINSLCIRTHSYYKLISLVNFLHKRILPAYTRHRDDKYKLVYRIAEYTSFINIESIYPTSKEAKLSINKMREDTSKYPSSKEYESTKRKLLLALNIKGHQLDTLLVEYNKYMETEKCFGTRWTKKK